MNDAKRETELRHAVEALYFGYRAFTALPDRILAEFDLGRAHHRILYFVQREPGISVGSLVEVLDVSKQALHRPLRELEEQAMLTIAPDPDDRRVRRLTTTATGAELEARLTGAQLELLAAVFGDDESEQERSWRAAMRRLAGESAASSLLR